MFAHPRKINPLPSGEHHAALCKWDRQRIGIWVFPAKIWKITKYLKYRTGETRSGTEIL